MIAVGSYIRRQGRILREPQTGKPLTNLWHLVESLIEDRVVTKCGRQMKRVLASGTGLEESDVLPLTRMILQPHCSECGL